MALPECYFKGLLNVGEAERRQRIRDGIPIEICKVFVVLGRDGNDYEFAELETINPLRQYPRYIYRVLTYNVYIALEPRNWTDDRTGVRIKLATWIRETYPRQPSWICYSVPNSCE